MKTNHNSLRPLPVLFTIFACGLLIASCSPAAQTTQEETAVLATTEQDEHAHEAEGGMLALPELEAAELSGRPLQVVATTSVIGDVVGRVGGDAIQLTTLIGPGQDSHSYEPATQDLTRAADADVIFVNGWNLEERLVDNLATIAVDTPLVPVSANIAPLAFTEEARDGVEDHSHNGAQPHTWFSVHNVKQWVENIEHVLSDLDPANIEIYERNAAIYLAELEELEAYAETRLATIPAGNRVLVTNHDSFGYFAHEYDFEVLGAVIPGVSTLAEPSANDLAELIAAMKDHDVCTIFTETSVSNSLAQTVAAELDNCEQVQVLPLYTEAIGPAGSGTDSYIGMFRANVDTIVQGLK
jgi:ABC-type Zn uptake system ZnuABC Zn-binding protein ZnuA